MTTEMNPNEITSATAYNWMLLVFCMWFSLRWCPHFKRHNTNGRM